MGAWFIDPSSLPGGKQWALACKQAAASDSGSADLINKALHCDGSTFGGFVMVLSLLITYGLILYCVCLFPLLSFLSVLTFLFSL